MPMKDFRLLPIGCCRGGKDISSKLEGFAAGSKRSALEEIKKPRNKLLFRGYQSTNQNNTKNIFVMPKSSSY